MEPGLRILDAIASPSDLKVLTDDELRILAGEIREQIVATASRNGGHVASSLGAVEIILAVHSLIDSPKDRFIFDVGHQAYAHKLLTGRLAEFDTIRTFGGISGFPKPTESPHDVHPSGHASDSLSIAFGLAKARQLKGTDEKIVVLIGDAAIAGGMAFEALNQIGDEQLPIVIILNDNEMSISHNVGAVMRHLGAIRASSVYKQSRDALQDKMENYPTRAVQYMFDVGRRSKDSIKSFFVPNAMIYEQLGIVCTPPIDGHDITALRENLQIALASDGPVLIHAVTKKGAGYAPAEQNPETFHGLGPFDPVTGVVAGGAKVPSYTDVFGEALVREARFNQDIVALTAAMKSGTGLALFAREYPDRFLDGGIAEAHVVGTAGGLALAGKKPVVAIYSTFLQRAFDQVVIDTALSGLDVVYCIDRAGLVGEDGPTHHGIFDLVYMRTVPGMRVMAPSNEAELVDALHTALALGGPFAIRYPRGKGEGVAIPNDPHVLEPGVSRVVREGNDVVILAFGRMVGQAAAAADILADAGVSARVVDMRWVKPIDELAVSKAAACKLLVTVEEGVVSGGAGDAVLEVLAKQRLCVPTLTLGIPDAFVGQGTVAELLHSLGLDGDGIARSVAKKLLEL